MKSDALLATAAQGFDRLLSTVAARVAAKTLSRRMVTPELPWNGVFRTFQLRVAHPRPTELIPPFDILWLAKYPLP